MPKNFVTQPNLFNFFQQVRSRTLELITPLSPEDACGQSMPDASPAKWHLAHTTWFYETFILEPFEPNFSPYNKLFRNLFNSYYNGIGKQYPRDKRGLLTRPSLNEIKRYAEVITTRVLKLELLDGQEVAKLIELGCHHEQQHQELMVMDVKHLLSCNPIKPSYEPVVDEGQVIEASQWLEIEGGMHRVGCPSGLFCFDNEQPEHDTYFTSFEIDKNLISNNKYLEFVESDGYQTPQLWLADGWSLVKAHNWTAPAYWEKIDKKWFEFTSTGLKPLDLRAPVCHVSYYEADAYANWAKARLPTEQEWEAAARFSQNLTKKILDLFGSRWQWTQSSYTPYPGFRASKSIIGEYNGKFMNNQMVLRGSSFATPQNHSRITYRNFFYSHQRWPFTGIRLCRDIQSPP